MKNGGETKTATEVIQEQIKKRKPIEQKLEALVKRIREINDKANTHYLSSRHEIGKLLNEAQLPDKELRHVIKYTEIPRGEIEFCMAFAARYSNLEELAPLLQRKPVPDWKEVVKELKQYPKEREEQKEELKVKEQKVKETASSTATSEQAAAPSQVMTEVITEIEQPAPAQPQLISRVIPIDLLSEQWATVDAKAREDGLTLSEWVRVLIQNAI